MRVPINFHSAELLSCSLCQSVTDAMAEAGADASITLEKLNEAFMFASELARFIGSLRDGIQAEIVVPEEPRPSLRGIAVEEHQIPQSPRSGVLWPRQFAAVQDAVGGKSDGGAA